MAALKASKKDLKTIVFSTDLVNGALNHLEFLKEVNSSKKILLSENLLRKAVYRYENIWLPYLASFNSDDIRLVPPLDVEIIWHSHMLCPIEYNADCIKMFGKILSHHNLENSQRLKQKQSTKAEWSKRFSVSFDYLDSNSVNEFEFKHFSSKIKYDLIAACKRQLEFYYQVSLPHYESKRFLQLALKRYKKFIYLAKQNPDAFLVPCYSIDLIWHTHQREPLSYSNDTIKLLGKILSLDDSVNDRQSGSKLNTSFSKTCELWRKHFNEDYFFSGGMYRGSPTLFDANDVNFQINSVNIYEVAFNQLINNEINVEINTMENLSLFGLNLTYFENLNSWSNIRLMQSNKLISFSRMIGLNELPSSDLMPNLDTSLNIKCERTMVLSDDNGDYAIVKGKSKPNSNTFHVNYLSLTDTHIKLNLTIKQNQRYLNFDLGHLRAKVDFKLGLIKIELINDSLVKYNKLIVGQLFTFIFSLICLYLPLIDYSEKNDHLMFNMLANKSSFQLTNENQRYKFKNKKNNCGCFY